MEIDLRDVSVGFVSTYPPTVCGLASYTASLLNAVAHDRRSRSGLGVVGLSDQSRRGNLPDEVFHHRVGDESSLNAAARVLNTYDTVSIQHEFGIFGGRDGAEVLDMGTGSGVLAVAAAAIWQSLSRVRRAAILTPVVSGTLTVTAMIFASAACRPGADLGRLYAADLAGGCVGALIAALLLIPFSGLPTTTLTVAVSSSPWSSVTV